MLQLNVLSILELAKISWMQPTTQPSRSIISMEV
jgi:hypothetical protein